MERDFRQVLTIKPITKQSNNVLVGTRKPHGSRWRLRMLWEEALMLQPTEAAPEARIT